MSNANVNHDQQGPDDGLTLNENDELKNLTDIEPKSNPSPWVARGEDDLFLLNKGDDDKLFESFLKPVGFLNRLRRGSPARNRA